METGWEVFDPKDGKPIRVHRWCWVARLDCHLTGILASGWSLDYARKGQGWTGNIGCTKDELIALVQR